MQSGLEVVPDLPLPVGVDPALGLGAVGKVPGDVAAAALVYRHTEAPGYKADDIVPGQGVAAAGELGKAVVHALHQHAAGDLPGLWRGAYQGLGGLAGLCHALVLLADAGQDLPQLYAAVAYGGVQVVGGGAVMALAYALHHIVHKLPAHGDIAAPKLPLKLRPALHDILLPALLFEPGAYLAPGLAGAHHCQPVPVGSPGLLACEYLDYLPGLHLIVKGHYMLVDLGAYHPIAHGAVYGIGEVDDA